MIFVEHVDSAHARVGWIRSAAASLQLGPVIDWPANTTRRLGLSLGSLLPPAASSLWPAHISAQAREAALRRVEVKVDGLVALTVDAAPIETSPTAFTLGRNSLVQSGIAPLARGAIRLATRPKFPE